MRTCDITCEGRGSPPAMRRAPLACGYLEVGVGVGIRQPGRARVLLVLERSIEHLGNCAEIENADGGGSDAVPARKQTDRHHYKHAALASARPFPLDSHHRSTKMG